MRDTFPTFEAPTLVLDLDAEDNQHVRPFDANKDGVPEEYGAKRSRDMDSMMARIAKFEEESERDDMNFTQVLKNKFNPWRVSELDILSVALLGPPPSRSISSELGFLPESAHGLSPDEITATVFEWNGIQQRVRNSAYKTIPYMLRRQNISERRRDERLDLREALKNCRSLADLERVIMPFVQTPTGRALVADQCSRIGQTCMVLHSKDPSVAPAILSFLNNLIINLRAQNLQVSQGLEAICVKLSLECGSFIAARRYIEACDNGEFQATKLDDRLDIMSTVLKTLDGFLLNPAGAHHSMDVTQRLLEIYGLLTSWDFGQDLAQPPMRHFYRKGYRTHLLYLMCLVRLGAFRTMWYQWHMDLQKPPEWAVVTPGKSKDNHKRADGEDGVILGEIHNAKSKELGGTEIREALADVYAKAVLRWRGATNYAEVLLRSVEFNSASENFERNCQFEIETIVRLGESRSEAALADDPRRASPEEHEGEIADIFSNSDIRDALVGLQELLSRIVASNDNGHEANRRGSTSTQGPDQTSSSNSNGD
ncbi:hypothetical protein DL764_001227 [Monosporascus ibericus]|uniref:Uncharacterized protein n=1 Tax=Monosporascus ibericus TaxID=155417 RepID=A0A4Q4TS14_9PEZI|nr:hypothetical protein DL764_001227 [Monosporascus ibericus]